MGPLYICSRSLVVYGYDQYLLIPSNLYIHTTASLRKPHGVVTVLTCVKIKLKYIYYIQLVQNAHASECTKHRVYIILVVDQACGKT